MAGHVIWEALRDFGNGERLYRCRDIHLSLGESVFEYWNNRLQCWRRVNNFSVRDAMHRYTSAHLEGCHSDR